MTTNAIYTPTPKSIPVLVCEDRDGATVVQTDRQQDHLLDLDGLTLLHRETASVVARGNLRPNGRERWYQVQLADGTRHSVIGEGS